MRIPALVISLVLLGMTALASAQTVERTIDTSTLGWGALKVPTPIETDGNLKTVEWLIETSDLTQVRVVAEHLDGTYCVGAWFDPRTSPLEAWRIERVGLVHKLFITRFVDRTWTRIVRLNTPACDP